MTRAAPSVAGVVLAGGESRRFGLPKWRARVGGCTLLERAVTVFEGWCDDILVVGRQEVVGAVHTLGARARFAEDLALGRGPLVGLVTGLAATRASLVAVVACDMPFADRETFQRLVRLARGRDAVVPIAGGEVQPLHAVYHRRCLEPLRAALARGVRAPRAALRSSELRVRYVDERALPAPGSGVSPYFSVNTPDDLRRARSLWRRRGPSAGRALVFPPV